MNQTISTNNSTSITLMLLSTLHTTIMNTNTTPPVITNNNATVVSAPQVDDVSEALRIFVSVCMCCIIAVSFFGNVLVCLAFKVNKHLRTVSNYFILNLAVSDLITTIFVMPFDADVIIRRGAWLHGKTACDFFTTMYLISAPASILNLLAVSIDRYRLISNPFVYERTMTARRALVVIAFIWLYATIMALLPLMGWQDSAVITHNQTTNVCFFPIPQEYSILISVLHFVIPPLIMAGIYFKIYRIARSHVRRIHRLESVTVGATRPSLVSPSPTTITTNNHHHHRHHNREPSTKGLLPDEMPDTYTNNNGHVNGHGPMKSLKRRFTYRYSVSAPPTLRKNVKAAKSLAVIVGTFFACWYPFTALSMALNAYGGLSGGFAVKAYVLDCLLTIGYLNSVLNPFLYAFHNVEFKKTYKKILHCIY